MIWIPFVGFGLLKFQFEVGLWIEGKDFNPRFYSKDLKSGFGIRDGRPQVFYPGVVAEEDLLLAEIVERRSGGDLSGGESEAERQD